MLLPLHPPHYYPFLTTNLQQYIQSGKISNQIRSDQGKPKTLSLNHYSNVLTVKKWGNG